MKHLKICSLFLLTKYERKTLREKRLDGEIAQQGKHLLHKHEDRSLGPWDPYKARHGYKIFNPNTPTAKWEAETGESLRLHQPASLLHGVTSCKRLCLRQGEGWKAAFEAVIWLSHMHCGTCTSTYTDMNTCKHMGYNIYKYINMYTHTIHIYICTHQAYTPSFKKNRKRLNIYKNKLNWLSHKRDYVDLKCSNSIS